ncbi:hypothetical protein [Candidatus Albibeggiatoa sp. nov. BB20]|uniref:hypothetical protein n=1 Tax=Candidatus Albibeggiatoa sp. nov. BB20 TaxID=3162723 RepID=UPI003365AE08
MSDEHNDNSKNDLTTNIVQPTPASDNSITTGGVSEKVSTIDKATSSIIEKEQGRGLVSKIVNGNPRLAKLVSEHEQALAKTEFGFREKALSLARTAQLQAIEEVFNDFLLKGKTNIRAERHQFFNARLTELRRDKERTVQLFHEDIEKAYNRLENIKHEKLRQKEEERIDSMIARFYDIFESLENDFNKILNENVKS